MDKEVEITNYVMPICVDWAAALPPLQQGDFGLVSGCT